jgi:transcriptional regulator with XRE-family HTH domain
MEMTVTRVTNEEFGERVGCDYTMASRLRGGKRLPSRELLERIVTAYRLDGGKALAATAGGPDAFADFLNDHVFNSMSQLGSTPD